MTVDLQIRPFAAADFSEVCDLDALCFPPGIAYPPEEVVYFLSQRGAICYVCDSGGRVAGWILGHARRRGPGHVVTIDVHPDFRRRKIGKLLMDQLEASFRALECPTVKLEVATGNLGAQAFYEQRGYLRRRTIRNYYADGGDAYAMELKI